MREKTCYNDNEPVYRQFGSLPEKPGILNIGADTAANPVVTGTADLPLKVVPGLPRHEDVGFIRHEAPRPD